MWRLHVLADFLRRWGGWGMLAVGTAMIDGSYWRESLYEPNFPDPPQFEGGDA